MKVVHICTSPIGGAGIAAMRLHKELNNNGIESYFLHSNRSYRSSDPTVLFCSVKWSFYERILRRLGLASLASGIIARHLNGISRGTYECISFPETDYRIENMEIVRDADIIHLHWVSTFINYSSFFAKIKKPIIWTIHDMNSFMGIFHYENDLIRNKQFSALEEKIRDKKNRIISKVKNLNIVYLTTWMRKKAESNTIFSGLPGRLIQNGIDLNEYRYINKDHAKKELGIVNGRKTVLIVSEYLMNYRKGGDMLSKALEHVRDECNLISVGNDRLNIPSNITHYEMGYVGEQSRMNLIYAAADLFILPSREDNLPNVMLESFASGTPVLSFKTGGMQDWISNDNGIYAENMDPESLRQAISEFCQSKYIFDPQTIRRGAESHFSIRHCASQYISLYSSLGKVT